MKYAIVKTGGKQYKVSVGDELFVDRLNTDGKNVVLPDVLLYVDGTEATIGTPRVSDVFVKAEVLGDTKGKKIRVAKFKAKARYRRVTGFRPMYTKLKIQTIGEDKETTTSAKKLRKPKSQESKILK